MSNQLNMAPVAETDAALTRLIEMLTHMRPAKSVAEREFVEKYIAPIGATADEYGNYWHVIGQSKVLWSCHSDTVHAKPGRQKLSVRKMIASANDSSCLGADCTVGVWIMLEMIAAKVPGCYVFHRDEEIGGHGSAFIAEAYPDILKQYDYAIAFDRRGTDSIITHQSGLRGASAAFAASIAPMLPPGYRVDSGGLFTDTANYVDHIAECSNLSVGYMNEHTPRETLDLAHAMRLRKAMIGFDESKLTAERDPARVEYERLAWDWPLSSSAWDDRRDLLDFVRRCPDATADFLESNGFTIRDLEDWQGF